MSALPPPRIFALKILVFYTSHTYMKTDTYAFARTSLLFYFILFFSACFPNRNALKYTQMLLLLMLLMLIFYLFYLFSFFSIFISFHFILCLYVCCISQQGSKDTDRDRRRSIELKMFNAYVCRCAKVWFPYHRFIHGISSHFACV